MKSGKPNKQAVLKTSAVLVVLHFNFTIPSMAPVTDRATGAIIAAISVSVVLFSYLLGKHHFKDRSRKKKEPFSLLKRSPRNGLVTAIGNTPLIRINSLSEATGCEATSHFSIFTLQPFKSLEVFPLFSDFLFELWGFSWWKFVAHFNLPVSCIVFYLLRLMFCSGFSDSGEVRVLESGWECER